MDNHPLLQPLIEAKSIGVISDFDGTLSHVVKVPETAVMTDRCRTALTTLRENQAIIGFVSGRGVQDLMERARFDQAEFIGNHGLEHWTPDGVINHPEIEKYRPAIEEAVKIIADLNIPGIFIEDKHATLSIHYRLVEDQAATAAFLAPIVQNIATRFGLDTFTGRMIFELRPPVPVHKGTALESLIDQYQLDAAVFLGDDVTDADAMRTARALRESGKCHAVAVGVVSSSTPTVVLDNADLTVPGVEGTETFLEWLASARAEKSSLASSS